MLAQSNEGLLSLFKECAQQKTMPYREKQFAFQLPLALKNVDTKETFPGTLLHCDKKRFSELAHQMKWSRKDSFQKSGCIFSKKIRGEVYQILKLCSTQNERHFDESYGFLGKCVPGLN